MAISLLGGLENFQAIHQFALAIEVVFAIILLKLTFPGSAMSAAEFLRQARAGRHQTRAALVGISLLSLACFRFATIQRVTLSSTWSDHFDALIYPLSQVVAGKTLLVDLPSQYGLFPEFLAPLFRLTSLSVARLSLVFAIFQLASILCLHFVLSRYIKNRGVMVITTLALAMVTYGIGGADGLSEELDPYFQYWPVRFLFPALTVFLFDWFIRNTGQIRLWILIGIAAVSLLWNLDTGAAIILALGSVFGAFTLLSCKPKSDSLRQLLVLGRSGKFWLLSMLAIPLSCLFLFATFFLYLHLKSGEMPNLAAVSEYQSIFYKLGFFMIPLPLEAPGAWMAVLGVYLLSFITGLEEIRCRKNQRFGAIIIYLSLLGLGLFVYYQGRSHLSNLIAVSWPAVLLTGLLVDRQLRAHRLGLIPAGDFWPCMAGVTALVVPAIGLLFSIPLLIIQADFFPIHSGHLEPAQRQLRDELDFIRSACTPGSGCLLLCKRQGIYSAELGLASAWKGPGLSELLLETDRQRLLSLIRAGRFHTIVLARDPVILSQLGMALSDRTLLSHYLHVATNSSGTLWLLKSKSTPTAGPAAAAG